MRAFIEYLISLSEICNLEGQRGYCAGPLGISELPVI